MQYLLKKLQTTHFTPFIDISINNNLILFIIIKFTYNYKSFVQQVIWLSLTFYSELKFFYNEYDRDGNYLSS
jgi:hypothetical protein